MFILHEHSHVFVSLKVLYVILLTVESLKNVICLHIFKKHA